jgi:hypothetical protein
MTAFEVYQTYLALKSHFTRDSYDFHKYGGKVNASVKSFESRRDRYQFEKLARLRDPTSFILANIIHNKDVWVGDLVSNDEAERRYKDWARRTQSLSYCFKTELDGLCPKFDENFEIGSDGRHPPLLQKYLGGHISLETLIILAHMTNCFGRWNRALSSDPVWKDVAKKMIKYQPFMKYDLSKMKSYVLDKFQQ